MHHWFPALSPRLSMTQLPVRLELAVKLWNCSAFAVDRHVFDQLGSFGIQLVSGRGTTRARGEPAGAAHMTREGATDGSAAVRPLLLLNRPTG
jgi:hypothetical protein